MDRSMRKKNGKRSIFRSLFAPLFIIMLLQALIFYFAAVYGGIEESLSQNAADVFSERLNSRGHEIENRFNNRWTDFSTCADTLSKLYADYEAQSGTHALAGDNALQIAFLRDSSDVLIGLLRHSEVNGVFLILNDQTERRAFSPDGAEEKYGLCIRDMDQESRYVGTEDLLLERAPSSIIDTLHCSLDSWWEAKFSFPSEEAGDYYYRPLDAAWDNPQAGVSDLMYYAGKHRLSDADPEMISCSVPLLSNDGYPYAVLGVELSVKYLTSLLPGSELNGPDTSCYVLAIREDENADCTPILGTGTLYARRFTPGAPIPLDKVNATGGFDVTGRGGVALYGDAEELNVYNHNNPFEHRRLTLLAFVEQDTLFAYIDRVKLTLLAVSALTLLLGIAGLLFMSRRFAAPITALATRVRGMQTQPDFELRRLGIDEIDQLVDAIEELNRNVGKGSARTEFFSRMSHDMRTPMNAIISFSSPALLEGVSEAVKDDYLQKIHASGQYLLELINEVLDMTKIESNKTELHMTAVPADRLFDTTIPIIDKLAAGKRIDFSVDIDVDPAIVVEADVQHLNQIVMNLLSNAVKFTPAGGTVRLSAALADIPGDAKRASCRIAITDTGIGMSDAFMKNLYTPFEQESSRQEGTGLGLSIAHKLVGLMGGTIDCTSRQGIGTTFTVTLPLIKAGAAGTAPDAPPAMGEPADLIRDRRILVCEDNAINMMIVEQLLKKWGACPEHAENGRVGVDIFDASPEYSFSAILMDVRMPVMDGLAAARAIRALKRADAKSVPIIAMTANAFAEDEQASQEAGMDAHLAKPVQPDILLASLIKLLGRK